MVLKTDLEKNENIDITLLRKQQQMLKNFRPEIFKSIEPLSDFDSIGNKSNIERGKKLIAAGQVGAMLIAGGQGTRLKFDNPKGMFPATLIKKKSLFQLFAEKTFFAGKQAGRKLPLCIMTSQKNHEQIKNFFINNSYFGLDKAQVFFFSQGILPILDEKGDLFLDAPNSIAMGPDGNGSSLKNFVKSGFFKKFQELGIKYINFILVDNPLADPFDAELVGYLAEKEADVVIKCIKRVDPKERVGVIVKHDNKVKVIEYTELPEVERKNIQKHSLANLSLFSFTMDFIEKVANVDLPLHLAHKANNFVDIDGVIRKPNSPNSWKFEEFIFDVLPFARKVEALLYPREICFSPLKNQAGKGSLETVKKDLQNSDRLTFTNVTGQKSLKRNFEISQEFYYPTEEFIDSWRGKKIPDIDYIS